MAPGWDPAAAGGKGAPSSMEALTPAEASLLKALTAARAGGEEGEGGGVAGVEGLDRLMRVMISAPDVSLAGVERYL